MRAAALLILLASAGPTADIGRATLPDVGSTTLSLGLSQNVSVLQPAQ